MTIEHGIVAGQRCTVVFLDRELKPCAKAEAALVKLTFANGELVVPVEMIDVLLMPTAGS
jgi:hypothetical protein